MSDLTSTGISHDGEELYAITEVVASRVPEAGASCVAAPPTAPEFAISEVAESKVAEAGASCAAPPVL